MESVISLVLAGTLVLAVVTGLLVAVQATGRHQESTSAAAVLNGVTERMRTMPYLPCATAAQVDLAYRAFPQRYLPSDARLEVRSVRPLSDAGQFDPAPTPCTTDRGAQLVSIIVTVGDRDAAGEVVLRDPGARAR